MTTQHIVNEDYNHYHQRIYGDAYKLLWLGSIVIVFGLMLLVLSVWGYGLLFFIIGILFMMGGVKEKKRAIKRDKVH